MDIVELRERVTRAFGPDLHRATPATVTEFLTELDSEDYDAHTPGPVDLDEPTASYEGIIKRFLSRSLRQNPSDSVVSLWKFACQMAFSMVEQHEIHRLEKLSGQE